MGKRHIVVSRWDEFQHYKNRDPIWIKNYVRLLDDDAYLDLTEHRALVLHRLWMHYAATGGKVPVDTASMSRHLHVRVTTPDLESLNDAGFIEFLLADC